MKSPYKIERKLVTDFYMWMVENGHDHNIRIRVETKAGLFFRERDKANGVEKSEGKKLYKMITSKTIEYGQLLDWQKEKGVVATSVKAHFFNRKGVLIGRDYKFVPYEEVTAHNDKVVWNRRYLRKPFGKVRQWLYETKCKITTILIRATQPI